jgi:hypothetical protein
MKEDVLVGRGTGSQTNGGRTFWVSGIRRPARAGGSKALEYCSRKRPSFCTQDIVVGKMGSWVLVVNSAMESRVEVDACCAQV